MIILHDSAREDNGSVPATPVTDGDEGSMVGVDVMTVLRELERGTITVDEAMTLLDDAEDG
jgi:hypothetical protein